MNLERLGKLETIDPQPLPPWQAEPFMEIEIQPDQEMARERAKAIQSTAGIVIYLDASRCQSHLGAAVVALDDDLKVIES